MGCLVKMVELQGGWPRLAKLSYLTCLGPQFRGCGTRLWALYKSF